MKVIIGGDHSAVEFKAKVDNILAKKGIVVIDVGVNTSDAVDYPDIVSQACEVFKAEQADKMVLLCGTGIGVSIAANKHKGVICALVRDAYTAKMAAKHNHANCIALGARVEYQEPLETILTAFFENQPELGRHERRVEKILKLDSL